MPPDCIVLLLNKKKSLQMTSKLLRPFLILVAATGFLPGIILAQSKLKLKYFNSVVYNKNLKLFQLTWGTKSIAMATDKRCEADKGIANFNKQISRVIAGAVNTEVIYAVNESGAYNMSDNVSFSGGIAWLVAILLLPQLADNAVVPVTYDEVVKFNEKILAHYASLSDSAIVKNIKDQTPDKAAIAKEVKKVNQVFDQKSLLAGTALLLKIMRQFKGLYEKKQFYLIKNGQVGCISAYVDQNISK